MITRSHASCLIVAAGVALSGCGRTDDEIVIAYRLIVENQARCQGVADDVAGVWGAAIRDGEDFDDALGTFFSEGGAGRAAASRAGLELIEERVRTISTSGLGDQESRPLLLELYGAHSAACSLALTPTGRSLITFSATRAGLDDRFAVTESKLRVLLPAADEVVEEQLSTLRIPILQAEREVSDSAQQRVEERRDSERRLLEAEARRAELEAQSRSAELEHQLEIQAAEARRAALAADLAESQAEKERAAQRQLVAEEVRARDRARFEASQRRQEAVREWHREVYHPQLIPVREAVGAVAAAWRDGGMDRSIPQCRTLLATVRAVNTARLIGSADRSLNQSLDAMLRSFEAAGDHCVAKRYFRAQESLNGGVAQWAKVRETLEKGYGLQP